MAKDKTPKEPGANRAALINALAGYKKPRVDTKDPNAIAERIEEYLQYCVENDLAPGVAMCANWLGINQSTLQSWYSGAKGSPEHQRVAARFYGIIQGVWEQDMHEGNINPVSGIFIGKAFYGYKDSQEIVVQHTTSDQLSVADLIAESKRLPGSDTLSLTNGAQTIDADFTILEDDPRYEKSVARQKKQAERKAAVEDMKPIHKQMRKEYLKQYYQEHKEEQRERDRRTRERKAEKAKNANKKAD